MKLAVIAFTRKGGGLNSKIVNELMLTGEQVTGYMIDKYVDDTNLTPFCNLKDLMKNLFSTMDGIIFIGACGIAVRSIAPYLRSKVEDPAVLVLDEHGTYVISLLSGHIGGGNELTNIVANMIGGKPVITTATDVNQKFAVDSWAKKNKLIITDVSMIKLISSSILHGEKISFFSELKMAGQLPSELTKDKTDIGICISNDKNRKPYPNTLNLIPKNIVLGIGCKRETPFDRIETFVDEVLKENQIDSKRVIKICSIDLKSKESGMIQLAEKFGVRFNTFSVEELNAVKGEFASSSFVKNTVGVDNVCERSAMLGSEYGSLIIPKTSKQGITLAVCEINHILQF
ncbi:MAG: cobalamin [Anaerocolumna sp.]|jgi:cobalt-precorrin 5A hydrolase|nr:cobalamin [Anaerocolumna sp.]